MLLSKMYKKFSNLFFISLILFLVFHLSTWFFATSKIFGLNDNESVGDLARLSYNSELATRKTLQYTLSKSHLHKNNFKNQQLDIITIGDSFSYAGGFGKNPFYQDYLATLYNKNILNLGTKNISEYIEAAISLHNNGFLKKHHPKYLLLESVVRLSNIRFMRQINWNASFQPIIRKKVTQIYHQPMQLINIANYKIIFYSLVQRILHKKIINGIYTFNINEELFTSKSNKILIYYSDIDSLNNYTKESVEIMNKNLNKLSKLIAQDGVKLIFMPVVDKFDLYKPYIKDTPSQQNHFFSLFRKEKKNYIFIDTKKILQPHVLNKEKDIFYIDDTHWSNKASEIIANDKIFQNILSKKEQKDAL